MRSVPDRPQGDAAAGGGNDCRGFQETSTVLFPSETSRQFHRRRIGLDGPVISDPIRLDRAIAEDLDPRYVTFANPQPENGLTAFARIALELDCRRPNIPLLVVEGRWTSDSLARLPVDLSDLTNLNRIPNTPEPRDIYRISRAVLMPSGWRESPGRGRGGGDGQRHPVLAGDRGALPETLDDAGFAFTIPERSMPTNLAIPTPLEVAPWVATFERLWDDPQCEAEYRALAKAVTRRWDAANPGAGTRPELARIIKRC